GLGIQLRQRCIERRCLAGPRRARYQKNAVWSFDKGSVTSERVRREPHVLEIELDTRPIKDPHDDTLAMNRRECRDAKIKLVSLDPVLDAAILGQTALCNVEMSQQLDTRSNGSGEAGVDDIAL